MLLLKASPPRGDPFWQVICNMAVSLQGQHKSSSFFRKGPVSLLESFTWTFTWIGQAHQDTIFFFFLIEFTFQLSQQLSIVCQIFASKVAGSFPQVTFIATGILSGFLYFTIYFYKPCFTLVFCLLLSPNFIHLSYKPLQTYPQNQQWDLWIYHSKVLSRTLTYMDRKCV